MNKSALLGSVAVLAAIITSAAFAGEADTPSINPAAALPSYSTGNDRSQFSLAPNHSEELGWSLKGAAASYLSDDTAIGLIVEYGANKREYLANAGFQLSDLYSFIGTIGMLEEHNEYVDGEGRETVQQMEYGLSLKSASEFGLTSRHEFNAYLADASTDSDSVEAGKVYGLQFLTDLNLSDATHIKLGGGHEWLHWDGGEGDDDSFTFSADASQSLNDRLSLTARTKFGVSESVYGAGLAYSLSYTSSNTIGVDYTSINGRNGIEDDQRVMMSWSVGFGAGMSSVAAADVTDKSGTIRAAADVAMVSPANNLLGDVMKRPAFLPERVLARAKSGKSGGDLCAEGALGTFYSPVSQGSSDGLIFLNFVPFDPAYLASYPYASVPIPATAVGQLFLRSPSNASSGYVDLGEHNITQVVYIPTGGVPSGDAMQIFFENLDDYWEGTSYDLKIIIKAEPNGCILAQGEYLYP